LQLIFRKAQFTPHLGHLDPFTAIGCVHPTGAETCWSGCRHPLFHHDPVTFSVVLCSTGACAGARFGRGHAGGGAMCSWFPYYTCLRGARSLAASMLATGLLVRANPPPVSLVGEGRAPFLQSDGVAPACACSGSDSVVAAPGRQQQEHLRGFWAKV
jgi:hypothetical protein